MWFVIVKVLTEDAGLWIATLSTGPIIAWPSTSWMEALGGGTLSVVSCVEIANDGITLKVGAGGKFLLLESTLRRRAADGPHRGARQGAACNACESER